MIDYTTLKHSDNGMPTYEGFLGPVLQVASTRASWKRQDLTNAVLKEVPLPPELASLKYNSKWHDPVAPDRINWAMSDLKIDGLLATKKRATYEITEAGRKMLKEHDLTAINFDLVHSQPGYVEHKKKLLEKGGNNNDPDLIKSVLDLTERQIDDWFTNQTEQLSENLLKKLRSSDPYQFEHMMVALLSNMGYKGTNGQSLVTQKSNDGGIDGIINEDPLGLRKIYVQVKRYAKDNVVGSPEIDGFSGALNRRHAERGVFITTSSFSPSAQQAAKQLNIALVDGEMLTNLMIQYKVGVQVKQTYELYDIDEDFFEE